MLTLTFAFGEKTFTRYGPEKAAVANLNGPKNVPKPQFFLAALELHLLRKFARTIAPRWTWSSGNMHAALLWVGLGDGASFVVPEKHNSWFGRQTLTGSEKSYVMGLLLSAMRMSWITDWAYYVSVHVCIHVSSYALSIKLPLRIAFSFCFLNLLL